jgi:hypothetical protein
MIFCSRNHPDRQTEENPGISVWLFGFFILTLQRFCGGSYPYFDALSKIKRN